MKEKKEICPISLPCNWQQRKKTKGWYCNNYRNCEYFATGWELPYYFDSIDGVNALIVKDHGYRLRFRENYYETANDYGEDCHRIKCEWEDSGWGVATNLPKNATSSG
jgi:hypothetical protein